VSEREKGAQRGVRIVKRAREGGKKLVFTQVETAIMDNGYN
jgi:hypothetical protein